MQWMRYAVYHDGCSRGMEYCDKCLFACRSLEPHVRISPIFSCCPWPLLTSSMMALQYIMFFHFVDDVMLSCNLPYGGMMVPRLHYWLQRCASLCPCCMVLAASFLDDSRDAKTRRVLCAGAELVTHHCRVDWNECDWWQFHAIIHGSTGLKMPLLANLWTHNKLGNPFFTSLAFFCATFSLQLAKNTGSLCPLVFEILRAHTHKVFVSQKEERDIYTVSQKELCQLIFRSNFVKS